MRVGSLISGTMGVVNDNCDEKVEYECRELVTCKNLVWLVPLFAHGSRAVGAWLEVGGRKPAGCWEGSVQADAHSYSDSHMMAQSN